MHRTVNKTNTVALLVERVIPRDPRNGKATQDHRVRLSLCQMERLRPREREGRALRHTVSWLVGQLD